MSEEDQPINFLNYYRCYNEQCQHHWQDVYPAQPDDDCPKCGARHCSPYRSREVPPDGEIPTEQHYLLIVEGDVEPRLSGPFENGDACVDAARQHRHSDTSLRDGLYCLTVDATGKPEVTAFYQLPEAGE